MTLTVGSLFSGIGGLDLGLERAGMTVKWQSEIDPYCLRVLAKHWPDVPNLGDVTKVDWSEVERVELVCGGFPCQPFSSAGKQLGASDERYLWPEVVRALRVLRPRYALLENVPGFLHAPEFGTVLGDLADLGYDAEWDCIPAAAVGAPHLRYRVFVVAHHDGAGSDGSAGVQAGRDEVHGDERVHTQRLRATVADSNGASRAATRSSSEAVLQVVRSTRVRRRGRLLGDTLVASPDAFSEDGRSWGSACESGWWSAEPDVGRVAHGVPSRVDRLRALGNAVVPQVSEYVGRLLMAEFERRAA